MRTIVATVVVGVFLLVLVLSKTQSDMLLVGAEFKHVVNLSEAEGIKAIKEQKTHEEQKTDQVVTNAVSESKTFWQRRKLVPAPVPRFPDISKLVCQTFWHDKFPDNKSGCLTEAKMTSVFYGNRLEKSPIKKFKKKDGMAVVFTLSRIDHVISALTTASYLHEHSPTINIEVHSESEKAYKRCQDATVNASYVDCIKVDIHLVDPIPVKFAFKPLAIMQSRYRHVLFLDVDTIPLQNPAELAGTDEYKSLGAIFWPDLWGVACKDIRWGTEIAQCGQSSWPEHVIWPTLNITWRAERNYAQEMDSGVMLIDSDRHWDSLALVYQLVTDKFIQKVAYGDKDCFRYAWMMYQHEFVYSDLPSQLMHGTGRVLLEHYWKGKPFFLHQHKQGLIKLDNLRTFPLDNTKITSSPPCYDGCVDPNSSTGINNATRIAAERWNQHRVKY